MIRKTWISVAVAACAAVCLQTAQAQVVGHQTIGISVTEADAILAGWSVKRSILGKPVFNEQGQQVGKVYDIVVAPDKSVSYAIVDAQRFVGMRHDVAVPIEQLDFADGKLVLPGATREALKAMPVFQYTKMPAMPKPRDAYQHP